MGGESFSLEIVALKSGVPVYTRLKAVCKRLLRTHDFRLVRISETTPALPPLDLGDAQAEAVMDDAVQEQQPCPSP
jgi:hypothetical protein